MQLHVMHLFYTSCIIYEHRAALYSERVKMAVQGLASIQHAAFTMLPKHARETDRTLPGQTSPSAKQD